MRHAAPSLAVLVLLPSALVGSAAEPPTAFGAPAHADHRYVGALKSEVRRLKRRIREQRRALGAAAEQLTGLQRALDARTAERDRALARAADRDRAIARAATLEAEKKSRPTSLAVAFELVRREVAHSEHVLRDAGVSHQREAVIAHAAMNYVVGHVSAPGYGYMNRALGTHPAPTAESVLTTGSGICGHAALTFAAIVKRFGLPVRSVQFYYSDGIRNHIAAEVFYDGRWHYYDPTWGAYYADGTGSVLSIHDARAHPDPGSLLQQNATLLWRWVLNLAGVASLGEETDASTRVEIDQQPFSGR